MNKDTVAHHKATWTALFGTWVRLRKGSFSEIWTDICETARFTLRPLQVTSEIAKNRAAELTLAIEELSISADGHMMVLRGDELQSAVRLPSSVSLSNDVFWEDMPSEVWELLDKLEATEEA